MLQLGTAIVSAGLFLVPQNIGKPDASTNCPISITAPSKRAFPKSSKRPGFIVDVIQQESQNRKEGGPFPEDLLVLKVFSKEWRSELLAELRFVSSYGEFELCILDLTGDGIEEFVLTTGEGRGTEVRTETLTILQRRGKNFVSLLSAPISGYFGIGRWWYRREFADINGDGVTDLRLRLGHDPPGNSPIDDSSLIPRVRLQEFVFDKRKNRFVHFQRPKTN